MEHDPGSRHAAGMYSLAAPHRAGDGHALLSPVLVLNASYEPLGKVSFRHAVRMLFREVATVEEGHDDRMIGPHPWPKVIRLVRYVAAKWMYRPAGYSRGGWRSSSGRRGRGGGSTCSTDSASTATAGANRSRSSVAQVSQPARCFSTC